MSFISNETFFAVKAVKSVDCCHDKRLLSCYLINFEIILFFGCISFDAVLSF